MISDNHLLTEAKHVELCSESSSGLRWKPRGREHFLSERAYKHFNQNLAGKPAGYAHCDKSGYKSWKIEIKGRTFCVQRIIWEILNGPIPSGYIVDHKNRNAMDNTPSNLRLATRSQNKMNETLRKDNQQRLKGVSKAKRCNNKWIARIGPAGRQFLGMFDTPEDAHAAYTVAAKTLYGEFHRAA
jgi:hypothetical protein